MWVMWMGTGRQQMKPSWRVHGVITEGGKKANIIPDLTETE
jgi:metal-dependent amidase/aminoacylase/carboxypeptidase family protein|eukprot:COSAG06_NODE_7429_length_2508_cov_4.550436_3_plen_41_part_00